MTTYRSQLIREVETDLMQARARSYLKQPQHPRQTYSEYKAERRKRHRAWLYAATVLAAVGLAVGMVVL